MMERIERTVLSNLIHNEEYTRRVLPFIKEDYFSDRLEKILFTEIYKFVNKYNALRSKEALSIEMNGSTSINEDEYIREDGGVKLNRSWSAAKTYNLTGTLFFNQDGEDKEVEVDQKFTVINPPDKPVIAPVQMQVFYVGLNNFIDVAFPGTDETTINVTTNDFQVIDKDTGTNLDSNIFFPKKNYYSLQKLNNFSTEDFAKQMI